MHSQFLEAQVISSSLDGQTVARRPARWGGWSSALITVVCCSPSLPYYSHLPPLLVLCLYTGMRPVLLQLYTSEQVCIG